MRRSVTSSLVRSGARIHDRPIDEGRRSAGSQVRAPTMSDVTHRGWRLTVYFALLVAVVAAAAAAATVYVFVQTDRDSRHAAESNARFAARTSAKQLGDAVATLRATVAGVAATPKIAQAAVQPACTLTFDLGGLSRGHIDVLQPNGAVACSSRTGKKPLAGYVGADWLSKVKARPVFLGPVLDRATGDRSLIVAARTPGNVIVASFMALEPVARGLASLYGGGRPVELLITSTGDRRVITRSIDAQRWIGTPLAGTPFAQDAGGVERRDVGGRARLYESSTVAPIGWRIYAGEDKAAALAAGNTLRKRQLLIILVGLVLVVLDADRVPARRRPDPPPRDERALDRGAGSARAGAGLGPGRGRGPGRRRERPDRVCRARTA